MLRRILLFALGLGSGVAVAVFIARNRAPVNVNLYYAASGELPLWVVVLFSMALGAMLPILLYMAGAVEFLLSRRKLSQRIEALEMELVALRNLPLSEAQIDLQRPRPIRPLRSRPALTPEVLDPDEDLSEGDLYPAVYEGKKV
jgi:uncharacterized integral membrane protein